MKNQARILVADDLSRDQRTEPTTALELASSLAERLGSEIHLVHAYHIPELTLPVQSMNALEGPYVDEMQRALEGESQVIRARRPNLRIVPEVTKGDTVEALIEDVKRHDLKLAVLETHGRKGIRRALLGSVAEEFIRRSPVPVLTVSPHTVLEPHYKPTKILVPVDFSKGSERVLEAATEFAQAFGASLVLMHVVEEWSYPIVQSASLMAGGVFLPLERDLREEANNRYVELQKLRESLPTGLVADVKLIEQAAGVAEAILDTARETSCNLILMGHHRAGRVQSAMLGSVNRQVVRDASCPVLTLSSG